VSDANLKRFWRDLFTWHHKFKRLFPWRTTKDSYRVLVAEKLLQKTRANDVVVNVYTEIIGKYPTPLALSECDVHELERVILPLGLRFRAQQMKDLARLIVETYNSNVPDTLNQLLDMPGIGEYCARATMCFAFHKDIAIVDRNIARFLHRLQDISTPIPRTPTRSKYLIDVAAQFIPKGRAREFNFALLDLCALVCKARLPRCEACPVSVYCSYRR
jgi:A/G-specific adenine glycosylase